MERRIQLLRDTPAFGEVSTTLEDTHENIGVARAAYSTPFLSRVPLTLYDTPWLFVFMCRWL